MADAATSPTARVKAPKKKTAAAKPKKPASHPTYLQMVKVAIANLNKRTGVSRQAICKYISANYDVRVNPQKVNMIVKMALRRGIEKNDIVSRSGVGATGSFSIVPTKKPKTTTTAAAAAAAKPKKSKASDKVKKPKKAATKPRKATGEKAKMKKPAKARMSKSKKAKKPVKKTAASKPKKAAKMSKKATPKKK